MMSVYNIVKEEEGIKRDELFDMIWNKYPLMELYQY